MSPSRGGFTLLELMLALALTGLILLTIGMAVDLHLNSFQSRRSTIEQSQLARAILRIIADDIRSSVQYYEQDLSSVEKLLGDTAEAAASGALDADALEAALGETDTSSLDAALGEETTSTNTQELASTLNLPTMPGIYGNQYELQIDVSRLPRVEEYQAMYAVDPTEPLVDIPSDVKTVTYYVQSGDTLATATAGTGPLAAAAAESDPSTGAGGLVRRELDRAVTRWAIDTGNMTGLQQSGEVIAPEVVSIEFLYFDGLEWQTEWDTESLQGLPVAIQVLLIMRPFRGALTSAAQPVAEPELLDESQLRYYRLVVRLPTGQISQDEATTGTTDTTGTGI